MKAATHPPVALKELGLGDHFSLGQLVGAVERRRGRPLRIVELAELSDREGICAMWLMTDAEDIVLHARTESTLHRQQFVLHELAHIILDHGADDEADARDALLPDIAPSTRRRLLGRQDLVTADEIAAETLADHLAAAIRGSVMHESKFLEIFG
ncbi:MULTISPECIES: ImmA/IrrE family metallo-endopeptidase [Microbacterium]|uniref:ImmA/IrrE family metallo-endopeptidase n=1 Tax=Microbacterium wangchenii TaxID=2541726 RepID=A0ABX5SW85_9MICO|nr:MULTISPECIES: ImmA/IrrE family metallo-endopeptidase [Microbacterium]MCK6065745.1 ImmA/IrrE family metallo-endopeptidase [Microbacterium sp. EYE_512]QBR90062.1 ImmA/IrrE family metallo-endopeptidase [Microbacterium wangchenii]